MIVRARARPQLPHRRARSNLTGWGTNLLVEGGRLKAVIDFGGAGVGDPALDVIPAWSVFGDSGRIAFRSVWGTQIHVS
jgi:Phosphotransferase enzyme family